jgi:hypothetical protein
MKGITKLALCAGLLLFIGTQAIPQSNSGQVVFSKTGGTMPLTGNSIASGTPFGFWIWCNGDAAPTSNGGYQLAHACQGEMYFYALSKPALHVVGQASEGADGIYTMHVVQGTAAQLFSGTLNPSFTCSLTNVTPGGGNSVVVSCIFFPPMGGGGGLVTTTGAIVNITGP